MVLERASGGHGLSTEMTVVLVLSSVGLDVDHQGVLVGEYLPAELALVLDGLEVRVVDFGMPDQRVVVRK